MYLHTDGLSLTQPVAEGGLLLRAPQKHIPIYKKKLAAPDAATAQPLVLTLEVYP